MSLDYSEKCSQPLDVARHAARLSLHTVSPPLASSLCPYHEDVLNGEHKRLDPPPQDLLTIL